MTLSAWELAFLSLFAGWGVMVFLRLVAHEISVYTARLEAEKRRQREQAQREARVPVVAPVEIELPGRRG